MVYTPRLKNFQKKIFFPINISVLASVGIHALFFSFILPEWDITNSQENKQKLSNTPVIELNQIERTRLPNLSPRKWSNWNLLPQFSPIDPQITEIPTPNFNSSQFPSIQSNNLPNLPPPPSASSLPPLPPLPSLPRYTYNIPTPSKLPPPPPSNLPRPNITPIPSGRENKLNKPNNIITLRQQQQENEIRASLFPPQENTEIRGPRVLINRNNNNSQTLDNQQTPSNSSGSNNNDNPSNSNQLAVKSPAVKPSPYKTLASALQKDVSNTSVDQINKNSTAFLNEAKVPKPIPINMVGVYPKDACVRKLEGNAGYGVIINAQGNIVSTKLIKSSGFPIFNQQALKQIQSRNFGSTGKQEAYSVNVSFKPNNCPSLSLSNLGKIPPKQQSLPQPVEENTAKPSQASPSPNKKITPVEANTVNPQPVNPQPETAPTSQKKSTPAEANTVNPQPVNPQPETAPTSEKKPTSSASNRNTN